MSCESNSSSDFKFKYKLEESIEVDVAAGVKEDDGSYERSGLPVGGMRDEEVGEAFLGAGEGDSKGGRGSEAGSGDGEV